MENNEYVTKQYALITETNEKINELAMKRQKMLLDGKGKDEACAEIEKNMTELRDQIQECYKAISSGKTPEKTAELQDSQTGSSGADDAEKTMPETETDAVTKFYTIASKETVREELPELLEKYAEHSFFALLLIEDGEEEQSVKLVKDDKDEMPYYPALDNAASDKERQEIMDTYFKKLSQNYFYARYNDIFM